MSLCPVLGLHALQGPGHVTETEAMNLVRLTLCPVVNQVPHAARQPLRGVSQALQPDVHSFKLSSESREGVRSCARLQRKHVVRITTGNKPPDSLSCWLAGLKPWTITGASREFMFPRLPASRHSFVGPLRQKDW